ncbi:MAG TPA: hypothetical protein VG604_01680 [Candidatus Saccharimonadales bacterium]|nr:hypothetical protein [Candidatus Saccharimonadales bacterium]
MPEQLAIQSLPADLLPQKFTLTMPLAAYELLLPAQDELDSWARANDGTWGYFADRDSAEDLLHSAAFAAAWPEIDLGNGPLGFSWLRYSKGRNRSPSYHLDADAGTGIAGKVNEHGVPANRVSRAIVNLHPLVDRHFGYLDADVNQLKWQQDRGYIKLAAGQEAIVAATERGVLIRRRVEQQVSCASVTVSRVAHAGIETGVGHFLASFSRQESER